MSSEMIEMQAFKEFQRKFTQLKTDISSNTDAMQTALDRLNTALLPHSTQHSSLQTSLMQIGKGWARIKQYIKVQHPRRSKIPKALKLMQTGWNALTIAWASPPLAGRTSSLNPHAIEFQPG